MKKNLSIKEIAQIANVSVATISRVMNQNGGYSAETEKRVWEVINKYQYIPNLVAKGLRTNKTPVVGIIIPDILNEFYSKLILQLQMVLFEAGYLTTICNTNESKELEERHVHALIGQNVSGLILISTSNYHKNAAYVDMPTVYIDRRPRQTTADIIYVESDNVQGGYLATKELLRCGCKKIAFITDVLFDSTKTNRYLGYCKALEEEDIAIDTSLIMKVNKVTIEDAFSIVSEALEQGVKFDGVMCVTDMLAIGAALAIKAIGLSIPKDIKITGFDDVSATTIFDPNITTIHQYSDEMTKVVAELLIKLIEGKELCKHNYCIPVTLVKRASTENKIIQ